MANAIYPKYKEALLSSGANSALSSGTVKVLLIDLADYTYSSSHQYLSDVAAAARVATGAALANKTVTNGLFDADDFSFTSVSGDQSEALILFIDTGTESTSRLVAFFDTGVGGLPVTPNGQNINITWNASGIFQL
jgi:hypothetical protein